MSGAGADPLRGVCDSQKGQVSGGKNAIAGEGRRERADNPDLMRAFYHRGVNSLDFCGLVW